MRISPSAFRKEYGLPERLAIIGGNVVSPWSHLSHRIIAASGKNCPTKCLKIVTTGGLMQGEIEADRFIVGPGGSIFAVASGGSAGYGSVVQAAARGNKAFIVAGPRISPVKESSMRDLGAQVVKYPSMYPLERSRAFQDAIARNKARIEQGVPDAGYGYFKFDECPELRGQKYELDGPVCFGDQHRRPGGPWAHEHYTGPQIGGLLQDVGKFCNPAWFRRHGVRH